VRTPDRGRGPHGADASIRGVPGAILLVATVGALLLVQFGLVRTSFLFPWEGRIDVSRRPLLVVGGLASVASGLVWFALGARSLGVAIVVAAGLATAAAFVVPSALFAVAIAFPVVAVTLAVVSVVVLVRSGRGRSGM
jgi:hypothetical protein